MTIADYSRTQRADRLGDMADRTDICAMEINLGATQVT